MMKLIAILIIYIPVNLFGQKLTNTTLYNKSNLNFHSIQYILNDNKDSVINSTIIIEGVFANRVLNDFGEFKIIKAKQHLVYKDEKKRILSKKYKHLVGKPLIRFILKPIFIEKGLINIRILMIKTKYLKRDEIIVSEFFDQGQWIFNINLVMN